jgi:hypothetical protein
MVYPTGKKARLTTPLEWLHRIAYSVSQLIDKPDHVLLGTAEPVQWKVTAQAADNLVVGTAACNTQMMRYFLARRSIILGSVADYASSGGNT